ncbi:MAG TPA: ParA family protein [Phenylobacterium sp.]
MVRTVAVVALKGGSGKTTVATHLALAAYLRGLDALVVDIDPQHSAQDVLTAREGPGPDCETAAGARVMSAQYDANAQGRDLLIVDTPAGGVEDASVSIVLADYVVMVVRPTLLDLAGLVRTLTLVRRLAKPATVVLNQAPVARESNESPLVKRILKGLEYMQAPLAPVILRSRAVYQTALEKGRSAEEMTDRVAAREIAALWDYIAHSAAIAAPREERPAAPALNERQA